MSELVLENNHELPEGWAETNLENVCSIILGQSPPSSTYNSVGEGLPFFQGKADFGKLYPETRIWCSKPEKIAEKNDLLLSVRAPVGSINLSKERCCIGRGLASIRPIIKNMDIEFFIYFFRFVENDLDSIGTGTTFKAISGKQIRELKVKLPPLNEQKRIVEKIENIFSKIESAKQILKNIPLLLNQNQKSILKYAFQNQNWKHTQLKNILRQNVSYGILKAGLYDPNGILMLRIKDISVHGILNEKEIFKVSKKIEQKYTRTRLEENDIVLAVMATLGRSMIISKKLEGANVNRALAVIKLNNLMLPQFLQFFIKSPYFDNLILDKKLGTAQMRINLADLSNFNVPLPSINEQEKTVLAIEEKISFNDNCRKTADFILNELLILQKSVLKQAFEGKLVTQDPNDESAEILLQKIKQEKEQLKQKEKSKKRKKNGR